MGLPSVCKVHVKCTEWIVVLLLKLGSCEPAGCGKLVVFVCRVVLEELGLDGKVLRSAFRGCAVHSGVSPKDVLVQRDRSVVGRWRIMVMNQLLVFDLVMENMAR